VAVEGRRMAQDGEANSSLAVNPTPNPHPKTPTLTPPHPHPSTLTLNPPLAEGWRRTGG